MRRHKERLYLQTVTGETLRHDLSSGTMLNIKVTGVIGIIQESLDKKTTIRSEKTGLNSWVVKLLSKT